MCGIAGYVGNGDRATLERMNEALRHRGPDGSGVWECGKAGLAHTRLAIIDTSSAGLQPRANEAGTIAVSFNGEIYNYRELRSKLEAQGVRFVSATDTEVILRLYERDGAACFAKLIGQFAIAIYDKTKEELVLARDALGEKPLYYALTKDAFVFGSELKALFAHRSVARTVDSRSLAHYLAREYVPAPATIYKSIFKLLPGHVLTYAGGKTTITQFWKPCIPPSGVPTEAEARVRLDELLGAAVERQLVADVPLGVFLSGGLDSSTVAYYAQKIVGPELNTFSIGFTEKAFDESGDARVVAHRLNTRHHQEILSASDALALVRDIPEVFDEPVADASVLPTMLLARFARKSVTVALGGDGADELLLGYPTFKAERYAPLWAKTPAAVRSLANGIADALPTSHGYFSADYKARAFIDGFARDPFTRHLQWLGSFREERLQTLLAPVYRDDARGVTLDLAQRVHAECPELAGDNALSHLYLRTYLPDDILTKVDRASMHYSLEVRAPFLDPALVQFILALPASYKYRGGRGKWLLRELMSSRLPERILAKKKQGFAVPVAAWLTGPLRPLIAELLAPARITREGFFNPTEVTRLVEEHEAGVRDHRKQLWTLLTFGLWHERWATR